MFDCEGCAAGVDAVGVEVGGWGGVEGEPEGEEGVDVGEGFENCAGGEGRWGDVAVCHEGGSPAGGEDLNGGVEVWIGDSKAC